MAKSRSTKIVAAVFLLFHDAIERAYKFEYEKHQKAKSTFIPVHKAKLETYYGHNFKDAGNNLNSFIRGNKEVQKYCRENRIKSISSKSLYDRRLEIVKHKKPFVWLAPKTLNAYAIYAGYKDFDNFLDTDPMMLANPDLQANQKDLDILISPDTEKELRYFIYGFQHRDQTVSFKPIIFKPFPTVGKQNPVFLSEDGNDYAHEGLASRFGSILELRFERRKSIENWQPFSMYFKIPPQIHHDHLIVLHGTYGGISRELSYTVAGEVILLLAEKQDTLGIQVEQLLFLNQNNLKISPNLDYIRTNRPKSLLQHPSDPNSILPKMKGAFELYSIDPIEKTLYRYYLEISNNYQVYLYSGTKFHYYGKLTLVSSTYMLHLHKIQNPEEKTAGQFDTLLSIEAEVWRKLRIGYIHKVSVSGVDRNNKRSGFPMVFLRPNELKKENLFLLEDDEGGLDSFISEREGNEDIITAIIDLERERWDSLRSNTGKLSIYFDQPKYHRD